MGEVTGDSGTVKAYEITCKEGNVSAQQVDVTPQQLADAQSSPTGRTLVPDFPAVAQVFDRLTGAEENQ